MIGVMILYTLKNIKYIFLVVLLTKLFVLIINLASPLFFTEEKNPVCRFIKTNLKEYDYFRGVIK